MTKVKDGSETVSEAATAFVEVSENIHRIDVLTDEIAAASKEQTTGIELLNQSVSEMDGVVQQNSAIADESSKASEELHIEVSRMKEIVNGVLQVVGGERTKRV